MDVLSVVHPGRWKLVEQERSSYASLHRLWERFEMSVGLVSLALASLLLHLRRRTSYQMEDPAFWFVGAAVVGAASLLFDGSGRRHVAQKPRPSTEPDTSTQSKDKS